MMGKAKGRWDELCFSYGVQSLSDFFRVCDVAILIPSNDTDFQKNNLTASSVGDIRVSMISSLLPFDRLRAKPCEINFLKIHSRDRAQ